MNDFSERAGFGRFSTRAACTAAVLVCALGLSACGSISEKLSTTMGDNSLIGVPANAPARPEAPPAFPAVHDIPPPRGNNVLTGTEQVRMEQELTAARDELNGTTAQKAADQAAAQATAKAEEAKKAKKPKKDSAPAARGSASAVPPAIPAASRTIY